jgi:hypothetical protein
MIHRERRVDYTERNRAYNAAVAATVGAIFQTETEYPTYVHSREFQPQLPSTASGEAFFDIIDHEFERPEQWQLQFDHADLGVYERVIFSSIAWSPYTVYCLVGEMGSGKTAVVKYIASVLKRPKARLCSHCKHCEPVVLRVDFNEGFTTDKLEVLRRTFQRRLYEQLRAELRAQFKSHLKLADFVGFAQTPEVRPLFAVFDEFFARAEEDDWPKLPGSKKANELFKFISQATEPEHRLEMLMRLLRYIVTAVRREPACAVLIFDNIDKLRSEAQMMLLLEILSLQRHAKMRVLIPLRRTTFEKLASQRAYSFGVINHSGVDPLTIARERIQYYLANFSTDNVTASVDARYAAALLARLKYVHAALATTSGTSRIVELVRGLAGDSVRHGLHIIQRMFINNVIPYDVDPKNPDELAWALLAGANAHLRLDVHDSLVANVFTNGRTAAPSLLILRILGLLREFEAKSAKRTMGNLVAVLQVIGDWGQRDIIDAVNYLLLDRRPLIWVDGRSKFAMTSDATGPSSREVLFLTSAGKRYFKDLVMSLRYFQEAMLGLDWDAPGVPKSLDFSDLDSRFRTLRACFRELQKMDVGEVDRFRGAAVAADTLSPVLITNRILYGIAKSAFFIFESQRQRGHASPEYVEWHSLLVDSFNCEHKLLGSSNEKLSALIRDFDRNKSSYVRQRSDGLTSR